jgi:hypothetical protein
MTSYILAFSFALSAGLLAGASVGAVAQTTEEPPIAFSNPRSFNCGANISWTNLRDWIGVSGPCGQGLLYTVQGQVPGVSDGFVKSRIVVPEDNDREWPAYNGEVHEIINHRFEVQFCIATRLAIRPIWLQAYTKEGKKHGERCNVTIVGTQLEE